MTDAERLLGELPNAVPRYTSYPTAPHFSDQAGAAIAAEKLAALDPGEPVSLYLHIPYCDRLCWFCGCHTKHTLKYEPVERYVTALLAEMASVHGAIGFRAQLRHVHFGGGSPSMLRLAEFERLSASLREHFIIDDDTEISVEVDPSDVTQETLQGLHVLGLTRASVGVQDFDEAVQKAINRPQTFEQTRDVIAALREIGIHSLNIDALYGLPLQTEERLSATIDQVLSLSPDRIALFGYAHVPWLKKHQSMIRESDLAGTLDRFRHAAMAADRIARAGYDRIGIDHFAKPDDALALAARQGRLYRNFQGYTTDACRTLIGLGASSISFYGDAYTQNMVATARYQEMAHAGELAAVRGVRLTADDLVRAYIIERLMCDFALDFEALKARFGAAAKSYVTEAKLAVAQDRHELCRIDGERLVIGDAVRPFARVVASWFDAYLDKGDARYSKAV